MCKNEGECALQQRSEMFAAANPHWGTQLHTTTTAAHTTTTAAHTTTTAVHTTTTAAHTTRTAVHTTTATVHTTPAAHTQPQQQYTYYLQQRGRFVV